VSSCRLAIFPLYYSESATKLRGGFTDLPANRLETLWVNVRRSGGSGRPLGSILLRLSTRWSAVKWRSWVYLCLFLIAFGLRVQNLNASPYGDEAYYYFVAHNLHAWVDARQFPVSGSVMPVFPLVYHWFSGTLVSLRITNAAVGSLAVILVMLIIREFDLGIIYEIVGGLLVAINSVEVQFSALAFLDMLGAVLSLVAILAYIRKSYRWAAFWALMAVLEKETYVFLAIALLIDRAINGKRIYWELIVAGLVGVLYLIWRYELDGATLQYLISGHAHQPLGLLGMKTILGGSFLVPLVIAGLTARRALIISVYLVTFTVILTFWGNAQIWYYALSVPVAVTAAMIGSELLHRKLRAHASLNGIAILVVTLCVCGGIWSNALHTRSFLSTWHSHNALLVAQYLDRNHVKSLTLLNCFWAYQYYPFGLDASRQVYNLYGNIGQPPTPWLVVDGNFTLPERTWRPVFVAGPYTVLHKI
jgi:hypothetical protein